jgi:RIP metalloprotease RseP
MAGSEWARLASTVARGLSQLFTNFGASAGQLAGPIAIVAQGSEIARADSAGLFQFAAIVNLNLAAVNLLPLPALDGGYLALVLLEAARGGRKLPQALERGAALSGLLMLTALGLGLMVKDTLSLL